MTAILLLWFLPGLYIATRGAIHFRHRFRDPLVFPMLTLALVAWPVFVLIAINADYLLRKIRVLHFRALIESDETTNSKDHHR